MSMRILIAFDDSENAMRAVDFAATSLKPTSEVTLFNVALDHQALCNMNSPELTPYFKSQQSTFCTMEDKKMELVETAMQKAAAVFKEAGFSPDRVHTRISRQKKSVAKDIIDEARNGYDLVVLGRKGVSGFKDFFIGSTSQKVLQGAEEVSVMVVH